MADGDVTIGAHDEQEDATGELVDASGGHVRFAHDLAEDPAAQADGRHQEWYTDQETLVRERQVQDVNVGHRLHLGEAQHHVDDQSVAEQADDAHQRVEDLIDQGDDRQIGLAVSHRVVVRQIVVRQVLVVDHIHRCVQHRDLEAPKSRGYEPRDLYAGPGDETR